MTDMKFHEKLTMLLDRRGISQAELARRAGMKQPRVNGLCNGKGRLMLGQVFALARALDVPLEYLADDTRVEEPPAVPSEREIQVMEFVASRGWDWVYRKITGLPVEGQAPALGHHVPTFGDQEKEARRLVNGHFEGPSKPKAKPGGAG